MDVGNFMSGLYSYYVLYIVPANIIQIQKSMNNSCMSKFMNQKKIYCLFSNGYRVTWLSELYLTKYEIDRTILKGLN